MGRVWTNQSTRLCCGFPQEQKRKKKAFLSHISTRFSLFRLFRKQAASLHPLVDLAHLAHLAHLAFCFVLSCVFPSWSASCRLCCLVSGLAPRLSLVAGLLSRHSSLVSTSLDFSSSRLLVSSSAVPGFRLVAPNAKSHSPHMYPITYIPFQFPGKPLSDGEGSACRTLSFSDPPPCLSSRAIFPFHTITIFPLFSVFSIPFSFSFLLPCLSLPFVFVFSFLSPSLFLLFSLPLFFLFSSSSLFLFSLPCSLFALRSSRFSLLASPPSF